LIGAGWNCELSPGDRSERNEPVVGERLFGLAELVADLSLGLLFEEFGSPDDGCQALALFEQFLDAVVSRQVERFAAMWVIAFSAV
jgi:hypothetical protein